MANKITINDLRAMRDEGKRFSMITCYDACIAALVEKSDVEAILVGDSLGIVIYGYPTTMPTTLDQIVYALPAVRAGAPTRFIVGDLPFSTYNVSCGQAVASANRLVKEGGCDCVKMEGGAEFADKIKAVVDAGIPVMGHIGLTPQTAASMMGGYMGESAEAANKLMDDIKAIEAAGAFACSLDFVPANVAKVLGEAVNMVIFSGGSGPYATGFGQNFYDMFGLPCGYTTGNNLCSVKRYGELTGTIVDALNRFDNDVKAGEYPSPEECYNTEVAGLETLREVL